MDGLQSSRRLFSVVIPIYGNAGTLEELVKRLRRALEGYSGRYELIFVVDASPDDSLSILKILSERNPSIRILNFAENRGQHAALLHGLATADSDFIAVMDGDLQDPPELLPDLIEKAIRTRESVYGYRRGRYQSVLRMASSCVFKAILGRVVGLPPRIGTFLVLPDRIIMRMLSFRCDTPQIVVMAGLCSNSWHAIPYERPYRTSGRSGYGVIGRIKAAVRSFRCYFECNRERPFVPEKCSEHENAGKRNRTDCIISAGADDSSRRRRGSRRRTQ